MMAILLLEIEILTSVNDYAAIAASILLAAISGAVQLLTTRLSKASNVVSESLASTACLIYSAVPYKILFFRGKILFSGIGILLFKVVYKGL